MQTTVFLQAQLDRLRDGDESARHALLEHSVQRFRLLARKMFRKGDPLRQFDETDDVLQKALIRLHKALATVKPVNVAAYCHLASQHIRWVLRDLARKMASAKVITLGGHNSGEETGPSDRTGEPRSLTEWTEFHATIDGFPDEERRLFDCLFYQGMSLPEASAVLEIPLTSLKRYWRTAQLKLRRAFQGEFPGDGV